VSGPCTVRLSTFGHGDADAVLRLFGRVYARSEPLTVAVGQTSAEFADWMRGLCPRAADEGLSLVAHRTGDPAPIGALIAGDAATPYADRVATEPDDPIHALLSELDAQYRADRVIVPGQWLHLMLVVVADEAAGQGLASRLIATCIGQAARRGWRHAYAEATHRGSQRAFARLGFEPRLRRDYGRWRFRGALPFARVADHGGVLLMDRALAV
jgi:GNAT superfamily N-acetyltransferase